ncbi:MAG: helix-turn-helix transcriptional regulator [Myxococcales bacterium]|nr:helix-turn-helix transcriptional regulator [Myxococcales bacterium]
MSKLRPTEHDPRPGLRGGVLDLDGTPFRYAALDTPLPALPMLTQAERGVVALLVEGWDNRAIAEYRRTSVFTVGNQIAAAFDKLGVACRFELVELVARLREALPEAS